MRRIQTEHHHVAAGRQHLGRRVGVSPDVELGRGGDIAPLRPRPAHHRHRPQPVRQHRFLPQRQRQIGQRAQHRQSHRLHRPGHHQGDDRIRRMPVRARRIRFERCHVAQSLGPVKLARPRRLPPQRPLGAHVHRHILAPGDLPQGPRIPRRLLHRHIPAHGGDRQQFERLRAKGEHQGHGVIHAGIAIDDEGLSGHGVRFGRRRACGQARRIRARPCLTTTRPAET